MEMKWPKSSEGTSLVPSPVSMNSISRILLVFPDNRENLSKSFGIIEPTPTMRISARDRYRQVSNPNSKTYLILLMQTEVEVQTYKSSNGSSLKFATSSTGTTQLSVLTIKRTLAISWWWLSRLAAPLMVKKRLVVYLTSRRLKIL